MAFGFYNLLFNKFAFKKQEWYGDPKENLYIRTSQSKTFH